MTRNPDTRIGARTIALGLALAAFAAATPAPAAANYDGCNNYGNQVNVGSDYECTYNYAHCDGTGGSGAGSGAGAGAGGGVSADETGAHAGANAGTTSNCCAGSTCNGGNQTRQDRAPKPPQPFVPQPDWGVLGGLPDTILT